MSWDYIALDKSLGAKTVAFKYEYQVLHLKQIYVLRWVISEAMASFFFSEKIDFEMSKSVFMEN